MNHGMNHLHHSHPYVLPIRPLPAKLDLDNRENNLVGDLLQVWDMCEV